MKRKSNDSIDFLFFHFFGQKIFQFKKNSIKNFFDRDEDQRRKIKKKGSEGSDSIPRSCKFFTDSKKTLKFKKISSLTLKSFSITGEIVFRLDLLRKIKSRMFFYLIAHF